MINSKAVTKIEQGVGW